MVEFRLKPEDSPPPDPHAVGCELLALLRAASNDAVEVRDTLARWESASPMLQRRARARAVELHETTARALDAGEALLRAVRAALAAAYR